MCPTLIRLDLPPSVFWTASFCAWALWGAAGAASGQVVHGDSLRRAVELKVMSLNVRYSVDGAGETAAENNWSDPVHPRRERVIRVIRENMPDVLGVQEPRRLQIDDLREALPEYAFYGVGRDDGKLAGEFAGVFYRAERLARVEAGSFWLSQTPDLPGTSFFTGPGALPRIASWVKLLDKQSGREFLLLDTHWEYQDAAARVQSARLIRQRLQTLGAGLPMIVLGDFNATADTTELKELVSENDPAGPQLLDSYRRVHPDVQPNERTSHNFLGTTEGARIDFIFHTGQFTPVAAQIVRASCEGHWPSDHYPVTATLRFAAAP